MEIIMTPPEKIDTSSIQRIAVLIPCFNEEVTVGKVVDDFRRELPSETIYVFDNNSTDATASVAECHGAIVIPSPRSGKGNVVRHMFETVDAETYIMVDVDDTYPAPSVHELLRASYEFNADMVVRLRLSNYEKGAFRLLHKFGNHFIAKLISLLFSHKVTDVLSGYRVFSRDFVRVAHLKSEGFEIETEMTLQALLKNLVIKEVPTSYRERPAGSKSKLNTFLDGIAILKAIFLIFKDYKPFVFFSSLSFICFVSGLVAGWFPIRDYLSEKYVHHVPLAILAASLAILSVLFLGIGLILNSVVNLHIETQLLVRKLFKEIDKT